VVESSKPSTAGTSARTAAPMVAGGSITDIAALAAAPAYLNGCARASAAVTRPNCVAKPGMALSRASLKAFVPTVPTACFSEIEVGSVVLTDDKDCLVLS
jgi:hypothetical protein